MPPLPPPTPTDDRAESVPRSPRVDEAGESWARTHQHALWRLLRLLGARPDEAEDVLQETLIAGIQHPHWRDWSHDDARRWLRTAARHRFCQLLRDRDRRRLHEVPDTDLLERYEAAAREDPDRVDRLRRCVEELAPRGRRAIELRYRQGLSLEDIGAELGLGAEGTRTLFRRLRAALRRCIERTEP